MTRACWRTMACLLVVGLGGLVVWADDPPAKAEPKTGEREAATCPAVPVTQVVTDIAPNPPPQPIVMPPPAVASPPVPAVEAPPAVAPPPAPAFAPPPLVVVTPVPPVSAPEPPPPAPSAVRPVPPLPPAPQLAPTPCGEKGCFDKPEMARAEPDPPARPLPPAPPIINVTRGTVVQAVPAVNSNAPPMTPAPVTPAPQAMSPFPWKLCLEFANGQTQAELRRGDEMLLRIQCEKMDLSTPATGLQAVGKVVVSGPCLEARCEKVSVAWQSGQVALDGSVYLSFQNKGVVQVMRAESLCFRLTGASVPVEFTARDVHQMVAPRP